MINITTPGGPYPENQMHMFNKGRDVHQPLATLYDVEGVKMFFTMVCHAFNYTDYFDDGIIGVVSFNVNQVMATGTGRYQIIPAGIKVLSETGALVGILQRSGFKCLVKE